MSEPLPFETRLAIALCWLVCAPWVGLVIGWLIWRYCGPEAKV